MRGDVLGELERKMNKDRKEIIMGKKRNCRMTDEEKKMHERAVKLRKMTDAQLCEFVDRTYGIGMEEGANLAETNTPKAPEKVVDGAASVKAFIEYLTGRVGTGNRIGNGTILQLNRELETAKKDGMFSGERQ